MTITGVLLAAGRGSRMGQTKQLLPWGEGTVIEASFDAIAPFCDSMVVVLGADKERIIEALGERTFTFVESDPDAEQLSSIKLGLEETIGDVLLHLADHPVAPEKVVKSIISTHGDRAIIPTSGGKGGHPVFIPRKLVELIVGFQGSGGLRYFWEEHPELVTRLPIENSQEMLIDLDTPEDYAKHKN
ncbi:MAG: nucleotidyltransferase family protein [Phycisphaerales bacterium]|jgi:molybdenum cofactor cytidylyltransferase|nr:nucleotidyltransferase family protein [Phycisphaerales bacterium]|tara:strand:+ start:342 stop:902 length:561 start_codon:yes stop_codon:yes gene_type:complete